ncbi:MAG TPA: hypothetical protein VEW48_19405 [Thermoanaerobaculia bacterium]|nr:hypothetical protein [Thermoanaerobaculia bacterium]
MRSVADDLREELQEEGLRLSFEERMALALRLGERGLEMFCQASGLDRETAIRERQRQAGHRPVSVRPDRMSLLEETAPGSDVGVIDSPVPEELHWKS